jgi:glycosyltransferase involved in cell wall biosynthesis
MIYYDITKMGSAGHRSGLTRVSSRLREELRTAVTPVKWDGRAKRFAGAAGDVVLFQPADWLLTVELFSEAERPGFGAFVAQAPCRLAAVFADAIPLRFPHITWPHSVQRHPGYMKLLASFDLVFAISEDTKRDLEGFWAWQQVAPKAKVVAIPLGSDFDGSPRITKPEAPREPPSLVCVGIIEPRKNQSFLLDVAAAVWGGGVDCELHVVGRVNPHFGAPIEKRMKALQEFEKRFRYHSAANDHTLARLYAGARAAVFPTIAEGCGLPVLESLWRGVPCVCSDLPVLRENTAGGGCLTAAVNDPADWTKKLRAVLTDEALFAKLRAEAGTRALPTWADTAQAVLCKLH